MLHAIETGKIQAGEAGLRGLRKELEQIFGMEVDISIMKEGGAFDNPPFIPINKNQEVYHLYNNLYCKVYLNIELEIEELYSYLINLVSGKAEPIRTIKTEWGELDLRKNPDFNFKQIEKDPDDFIFWQYYLDIEPQKDIEKSKYISQIAKLLNELNKNNIKAVASCDFEELL